MKRTSEVAVESLEALQIDDTDGNENISPSQENIYQNFSQQSQALIEATYGSSKKPLCSTQVQDGITRTKVRRKIRDKKQDIENHREAGLDADIFEKDLDDLNSIYAHVLHPSEAKQDVLALAQLGLTGVQMTQKSINARMNITCESFMQKIKELYMDDSGSLDFLAIDKKFAPFISCAPSLSFMNGPIHTEVVVKERKKSANQKPARVAGEAQKPELLKKNNEKKTMTDGRAKRLGDLLHSKTPKNSEIPLPHFLINPDPENGFHQTVENLFDFAFLVKHGGAQVSVSESGMPYCSSAIAPDTQDAPTGQCVVKYTEAIHRDAIKAFNIRETQIPARSPSDLAGSSSDRAENSDSD